MILTLHAGAQQRIRADSTFQSLGNWTTIEKTIGHINAFSKEDSVHYYTPGGMALRYCYKFGAKWNLWTKVLVAMLANIPSNHAKAQFLNKNFVFSSVLLAISLKHFAFMY